MDSSAQFRILLDSLSDYAIFLLDSQGFISSWSVAAENIFGYAAKDIQGVHFSRLYSLPDMEDHKPEQELRMAAAHGRFEDIGWRRRSNDSLFWADAVLCPIRGEDGRLHGFSQVVRDISERKRAEDLLREKDEELSQARKMEAIGRLAGGIAHDFNNFMTGIIGLSDEIRHTMDPEDPRRADLDDIVKTAQRAQALTRDLLAFGRRQATAPKILNISTMIQERKNFLQKLLGPDIEVQTDLTMEAGNVLIDAAQLDQIFVNLLANARDAMPHGGRVVIQTQCVRIAHAPRLPEGAYVRITVTDTGVGMTPEILSKLFEPFFTTKPHGKGTGLGLATVYGIVKQNHGDITVESAPAKGTRVQIMLPAVDLPAATEPLAFRPAASTGSETILVVEDDEVVRRVVSNLLRQAGYEVIMAGSGPEALQRVDISNPRPIHLLLTDVVMPHMNGRFLAAEMAKRFPDIRILFMSAYAEGHIQDRGVLDPDVEFIEKSNIRDTLLAKVSGILNRRSTSARV